MKSEIFILATAIAITSPAAVPLRWTVETSRLQPAVFDVVRGETLNLEAAFQSYGKPLSMAAKPCAIFYQTNGMGSAWWTAPATVRTAAALSDSSTNAVTNVVAATFTPSMDPGATVINGFLGSTGDIYRAAFTLRFRHGPGETPNALPIPPQTINWANVANVNADSAPFVVKGGSGGLTPDNVTNIVDGIVASSNLCTVAAAEEMRDTRLAKIGQTATLEWDGFNGLKYNGIGGATIPFTIYYDAQLKVLGGEHYLFIGQNSLYDYIRGAGTLWTPSDKTLANYGITDSYTKTETDYRLGLKLNSSWATDLSSTFAGRAAISTSTLGGDADRIKEGDVYYTPSYLLSIADANSTNAATSVVSNYLDYALVPLSGTSVNLASGEIGNLSLSSEQTDLTVNLDFSAAADRSGDCMLYLINEADTDMTVGPSSVITIGWDGADIKAGTNVVMFTRMKREGDNSLVMVSTKEIK